MNFGKSKKSQIKIFFLIDSWFEFNIWGLIVLCEPALKRGNSDKTIHLLFKFSGWLCVATVIQNKFK